jgi:hypothetical protein
MTEDAACASGDSSLLTTKSTSTSGSLTSKASFLKNAEHGQGHKSEMIQKLNEKDLLDDEVNPEVEASFDDIYDLRKWGRSGDGSGEGSGKKYTLRLQRLLRNFIVQEDIHVMFDLGCGQMLWTREFLKKIHEINGFEDFV